MLQIALYGELLGAVQGRPAHQGSLMLGTGEAEVAYKVENFSLDEVRYYVRRAGRRLEAFAADLPTGLTPEPCGYCGKCGWLADVRRAGKKRTTSAASPISQRSRPGVSSRLACRRSPSSPASRARGSPASVLKFCLD